MRGRVALLVVPLLLAGCGGGDGSSEPAAEPSSSAAAAPVWNPCDGLDAARVGEVLGTEVTVDRGTDASPRCALVPTTEGEAVVDANYLDFPEGLDAAWEQMGAPDDGSVREPRIAGAEAARLVANPGSEVLGVTGFVQVGDLVLVVNAADTAPYDQAPVVAAVKETMRQLAAYAGEDPP